MIYLSFILPAYNIAEYLPEAIETLTKLPQDDIEVVIVNDGSNDSTLAVAQSFVGQIKNLKILDQKNAKLATARNNGFDLTTGRYVHFFDPDDILIYEGITQLLTEIIKSDNDIIIGNGFYYRDGVMEGRISADDKRKTLGVVSGPEYFQFANQTKEYTQFCWLYFIRRDFLIENKIRFTDGLKHEDKEFSARCYSRARKVTYTGIDFILYRQRSTSISHDPKRDYSPESVEAYRIVISNLSKLYRESQDDAEKSVLNRTIAECYATIYRRIVRMKKYQMPEVKNYAWSYINESNGFSLLNFKNKLLVLETRFKAFYKF